MKRLKKEQKGFECTNLLPIIFHTLPGGCTIKILFRKIKGEEKMALLVRSL
jgi:hypothetical protein